LRGAERSHGVDREVPGEQVRFERGDRHVTVEQDRRVVHHDVHGADGGASVLDGGRVGDIQGNPGRQVAQRCADGTGHVLGSCGDYHAMTQVVQPGRDGVTDSVVGPGH
jgi:hypothetical protein